MRVLRKCVKVLSSRFYYRLQGLDILRRSLKNARTEGIFTKRGTLLRKIKDEDFKGDAFYSLMHSMATGSGVKKNSLSQPIKDFVKDSESDVLCRLNLPENLHYEMRPSYLTDDEIARSQRVAQITVDLGVT